MKKLVLCLICILPLLKGNAKNLYVSTTGNNNNDGSIAAPFRNIQNAANVAQPGDSVIVMDGEYKRPWNHANCHTGEWCQAAVILIDVHGTPGNPIVFKSQNKHGAKIKFYGRGGFIGQHCSYIVIDGFEIEGPGADITKQEAIDNRLNKTTYRRGWGIQFFDKSDGSPTENHHIEIRNNKIHHTPNAGIRMQDCDYVVIEDNELHDVSWWSSDANGGLVIAAKKQIDTKQIVKIIVRRNKIYHAGNYNIFYIQGNNSAEYGGQYYTEIDDGSGISFTGYVGSDRTMDGYDLVENNICFDNGMNGLTFQQTKNGIIRNNTVYGNNAYPGHRIYGGIAINAGENVKVYNNIAACAPSKPNLIVYNVLGTPNPFWAENNISYLGTANAMYGAAVIDTNPLFVNASIDPAVADFSLQAGSPAIDLGTSEEATPDDFFGHARPEGSANDAGAIEYSSDGQYTNAGNTGNFWDDTLLTNTELIEVDGEYSLPIGEPEILYLSNGDLEIIRYKEDSWMLFSLDGKMIYVGRQDHIVKLSTLKSGTYLLRVGSKAFKVIRP